MGKLTDASYPSGEQVLLRALNALFDEWQFAIEASDNSMVRDNAASMTFDGFYPYYTRQSKRILFLGRDAYGVEGCSYTKLFYEIYRDNKKIGKTKHLNQHLFHSRLLRVAWGLLNGMPEWKSIPMADIIGSDLGSNQGISFAFMNLGKIRRNFRGTSADFPMIDAFCEESTKGRNFIADQISILMPDVVISMHLAERLDYLGDLTVERTGNVAKCELMVNGQKCVLLDCWHFSATNKGHIEHIYRPICEALQEAGWS